MKKIFKIFLIGIFLISILISVYASRAIDFSRDEFLFLSAQEINPTRFYYVDTDNTAVEFYTIYNSGTKKEWLSIDEVNPHIKDAFIATEDRNFYTHPGFDAKRTFLAALNSLFHFRSRFGASTITQQLIKNISGDSQNTLKRKIDEILRATNLEKNHTKDEILELYLNIVPMGNGISGVSLASKYYFGKDQSELSLAESALIAGITNAPSRYNPFASLEGSCDRRDVVLYSMLDAGYISDSAYKQAIKEKVDLNKSRNYFEAVYPWFVETVCNDFCADYSKKHNISESAVRMMILNGGLEFYTTMDIEVQTVLESYFENPDNLTVDDNLKLAMAVYDSRSGYLRGIIGDKGKKSGNRIISNAETLIMPGSSIKPLSLYAPIIESGKYNWASIFDDSPVSFVEKDGEIFEYPRNYPRVYEGGISLHDALCASKNTVATRIFNTLDKNKLYRDLKNKLHFDTLVENQKSSSGAVLSDIALAPLALGQLTNGVSLRALTEAYSVFTHEGDYFEGISYTSVCTSHGEILYENEQKQNGVFSRNTAQITALMLADVTEMGTAKRITLGSLVDTAGKTGTSGNDLDRLFIGFTPYYLAGIWCGYGDSKTAIGHMEKSHLVMWDEVMHALHATSVCDGEELDTFNRNKLLYLPYCSDSGMLVSDACQYDIRGQRVAYGYFSEGNVPKGECDKHVICYFNQRDGKIYDYCEDELSYTKIALLDVKIRDMPIDVKIADEEFSYHKRKEYG